MGMSREHVLDDLRRCQAVARERSLLSDEYRGTISQRMGMAVQKIAIGFLGDDYGYRSDPHAPYDYIDVDGHGRIRCILEIKTGIISGWGRVSQPQRAERLMISASESIPSLLCQINLRLGRYRIIDETSGITLWESENIPLDYLRRMLAKYKVALDDASDIY